jgi:hypothetical protein
MKNKRHARAWKPRPIPRFFKKKKTKRQKKIVYYLSSPKFHVFGPKILILSLFLSKNT